MSRARLLAAVLLAWPALALAQDDGSYSAAGGTELMDAAYNGSLRQAKALIKQGVRIEAEDNSGETALMYAVSTGHDEIAKLLLEKGADADHAGPHGDTALFYAALKNRANAARMLLEKGAKAGARNVDGAVPLTVAVSHGAAAAAAVLLEKGADPNVKDNDGSTPLITAAFGGRTEIARLLIDKGADLDVKNNAGSTALIMAASTGRAEIVKMLIEKGADIDCRDAHGESAVEYAKAAGYVDAAAAIQKALDDRAAARALQDKTLKEQEAARAAEAVRLAALEEERRRREHKPFPWGLAGAAAAALIAAGIYSAVRAKDKRRRAAAAVKDAAVANVRALLRADPERAYAALQDYVKEFRDTTPFPPDELLRLYEVRDRARKPDPAALKKTADVERKRVEAGRARSAVEADPARARDILDSYRLEFGDAAAAAELLAAASALSQGGRHPEALQLVSGESELVAATKLEDGCENVIEVFERGGALDSFFDRILAAKTREFQLPYARAFLRLNKPALCRRLMTLVRVKDRDGRALVAEALAIEGDIEEAARTLGEGPRGDWSFEEWSAYFRISLRRGRAEQAEQAYDRIKVLHPLRRDPRLYFAMAEACEQAGMSDLAGELYDAFARADLSYRDAAERARKLEGRRKAEERAERLAKRQGPAPGTVREAKPMVAGRWELGAQVGEGRLGPVFSARDEKQGGRKTAVRRLRPELLSDRARFLHEAKLVSHLSHPFIVGLLEIVEQGGQAYAICEFAEGESLAKLLAAKKRLGLLECRNILDRVCQAIDYAHLRNVLHKDLKPANVMVDAKGLARVADFGLLPGTPAYMAPEQHEGKPGRASDVYSLGVCLYEMAAGALPFSGPDFAGQKKSGKFAPPSALVPGLPKELDALIAGVLDPEPGNRIADASELLQELKRL